MEIEISEDMLENIEKASKKLDLDEKELVSRAIKLYLYNIKSYMDLKEELEVWEKAGAEDLVKFEKQI